MRKFLLATGAVILLSISASAQSTDTIMPATAAAAAAEAEVETPAVEVFAGYSYLRIYGEDSNGGNVAITGNVNRWFGVTVDVSAHAGKDDIAEDTTLVTAGPKFTYRRGPVTPYAHFLFGGAFGGGESEGAIVFGGGLDAKVGDNVAIRIAQVDYVATTFRSNNARISAGIVFRFGNR